MKRSGRRIETRGTTFLRAAGLMAIVVVFAFGLAHGTPGRAHASTQSTASNPSTYKFEVATIKPKLPTGDNDGVAGFFGDNTFRARNYSMKAIIEVAYGTPVGMHDLLQGGPNWITSERYDMTAKMDAPTADRLKKLRPDERTRIQNQMLQELLADLLNLAIHREPRELPVYFLTIAKNGPKLKEAKPGDTYEKAFPEAGKFANAAKAGEIFLVGDSRTTTMYAFGFSIPALAWRLTSLAQRTVEDRTGLTGSYDITLKYCSMAPSAGAPDGQAVLSASDPCGAPAVLTAVQQQLGLKMEAGKGPVEIVVIDHVERPSGN